MQRYKLIQTQKNFYCVFFNKKSIISFNKNFLIQKPNNIYLFVKTCTINSSFSFVCNNRMFGETFLSYHNVSKKGLFYFMPGKLFTTSIFTSGKLFTICTFTSGKLFTICTFPQSVGKLFTT